MSRFTTVTVTHDENKPIGAQSASPATPLQEADTPNLSSEDQLGAGDVIAIYRIEARVGAGGMGEVYKALDTRLNRLVAVKILSASVADAAARRRFQREAQTASSLNHPHILTVHDAGEVNGRQYLVTELVDGGTLRTWLQERPRSWREVIELLVGVADGLATAHEAGILHRDVKPANILVSRNGYAKLADFGLAKLVDDRSLDPATRTATIDGTRAGIVGTVAYMSPEQATGGALDARSDVFSFGVVLHEAIAGRRPFAGVTDLDLLNAIVRTDAAPLPSSVPPELRLIAEKALEKDRTHRYQTMRELVIDLRRLLRKPDAEPAARRTRSVVVIASVAAVAAVAGAAVFLMRHPPPPVTARSQDYVQLTNFADSVVSPAISPDGRMLSYIRGDSPFVGRGEVYVQMLPNGDPVQLTHDETQKMSPAFSPDGSRIAYTTVSGAATNDWNVFTVPIPGGEPTRLLSNASGLTWIKSTDALPRVLFSEKTFEAIHMVVTTATENRLESRRAYVPPDINEMAHRSSLSPDGRSLLVVEMGSGWHPCQLVPFSGGPARAVGPADAPCTDAGWSPDGQWMYLSVNAGNGYHLWRQRFPNGAPEQITAGATEEQGIAVAGDGRSVLTSVGEDLNTIWIHDAQGDRQITSQGYAYLPKFSRDDKRLYYLLRSGTSTRSWVIGTLWTTDLTSGRQEKLLSDFLMLDYSVSPDGTRVAFAAAGDAGRSGLWIASLTGNEPPRRLDQVPALSVFGSDGDLFYVKNQHLYRMHADGSDRRQVIDDPMHVFYAVSPDEKWVAAWSTNASSVVIYPLAGGRSLELCRDCGTVGAEHRGITPPVVAWSADGKSFYIHFAWKTQETYTVPLAAGRVAPALPAAGLTVEAVAALPGARRIPQLRAFVGHDPSTYVFMRNTPHRNIYRIPLPER